MKWINCTDQMPKENNYGSGTKSNVVEVLLDNKNEDEDWLINGKWVMHCRIDSTGGYPVAWRYKDGKRS